MSWIAVLLQDITDQRHGRRMGGRSTVLQLDYYYDSDSDNKRREDRDQGFFTPCQFGYYSDLTQYRCAIGAGVSICRFVGEQNCGGCTLTDEGRLPL